MLYISHKFQWQPLQTGKAYAVNVKIWWEGQKNKDGCVNIFKHIKLTAKRTFSQVPSIFLFYGIFWNRQDCFVWFWQCILPFFVDRHDVKMDAIFFCYILRVLTERMFENLRGFHSYKFYNDKLKTTILWENVALSLGLLNFYWSFFWNSIAKDYLISLEW